MQHISTVKILLSSLLVSLCTISCTAPSSAPHNSQQTQASSPSTSASPSAQNYIEATPIPETAPNLSTYKTTEADTAKDSQIDPTLKVEQPNPSVQAARIKEPYDKDGKAQKVSPGNGQSVGQNTNPAAPGKAQAPKSGIPVPPKPGVPEAPAPGKPSAPAAVVPTAPVPVKPQEPQTVIPANPKPAIPQVKAVRPTSPSKVKVSSTSSQPKSSVTKSKVKINLKNLPDKQ